MAATMAMVPRITAALPILFLLELRAFCPEGNSQSSQHNAAQRRKQQAHHNSQYREYHGRNSAFSVVRHLYGNDFASCVFLSLGQGLMEQAYNSSRLSPEHLLRHGAHKPRWDSNVSYRSRLPDESLSLSLISYKPCHGQKAIALLPDFLSLCGSFFEPVFVRKSSIMNCTKSAGWFSSSSLVHLAHSLFWLLLCLLPSTQQKSDSSIWAVPPY